MGIAVFALMGACGAFAQGTFQNLDFEAANVVPISGQPYAVTAANALPDWTVNYGVVQQTQIYYNDPSLGGTAVTLEANGYPGTVSAVVDGNFSVLLQGGQVAASISQTGQIPSGTQSLLFESGTFSFVSPEVSIGSDVLTLFPLTTHGNFTTYGANIPSFAGATEQLTFTVPPDYGAYVFDDISFSPNPITVTPEPDPVILMGIGGALFAAYRRFAPKRK